MRAQLTNVLAHQGIYGTRIPFKIMHNFPARSVAIDAKEVHDATTNFDNYCMRYPLVPVLVSSCSASSLTGLNRKFELRGSVMTICSTKQLCLQAFFVPAVVPTFDDGNARWLVLAWRFPSMVSFTSASAIVGVKRVPLDNVIWRPKEHAANGVSGRRITCAPGNLRFNWSVAV